MDKYQTIVIKYQGDTVPVPGFNEKIKGCEVTGLAVGDALNAEFELSELIVDLISMANCSNDIDEIKINAESALLRLKDIQDLNYK